jgi:hypothetical protein
LPLSANTLRRRVRGGRIGEKFPRRCTQAFPRTRRSWHLFTDALASPLLIHAVCPRKVFVQPSLQFFLSPQFARRAPAATGHLFISSQNKVYCVWVENSNYAVLPCIMAYPTPTDGRVTSPIGELATYSELSLQTRQTLI